MRPSRDAPSGTAHRRFTEHDMIGHAIGSRDRRAARRGLAGGRHRPAAHRRRAAADAGSTARCSRSRDSFRSGRARPTACSPSCSPRSRREPGTSSHEYDFSFSWRDNARIRGNAFSQRGPTAVALRMIPRDDPDAGRRSACRRSLRDFACRHQGWSWSPGRPAPASRPRWPRMIDQINTRPGLPHHHHRGPDRVRARPQAGRGEPARGRHRHRLFPDALRVGAARGPRRPARRRDARPGVDPVRADHRRDRPPGLRDAAHQRHRPGARPHRSTSSRPSSRPRSACSSPAALTGIVYQRLMPADRRRAGRRVRGAGRHHRRAQPDQGGQDPPAAQLPGHRPAGRHGDPGAVAVGAGPGRPGHLRGRRRAQPLPEGHRAAAPAASRVPPHEAASQARSTPAVDGQTCGDHRTSRPRAANRASDDLSVYPAASPRRAARRGSAGAARARSSRLCARAAARRSSWASS